MMLQRRTHIVRLLFAFAVFVLPFAVLLLLGNCKQVDFTAPTGSTLRITAQPTEIGYGQSSSITVVGTRENGAPLPDGTVVTFTVDANLGTVSPNPAETNNGLVHATFRAGNRSGEATIEVLSGEATGAGGGGTQSQPTSVGQTTTIVIGDARAESVLVSANPTNLPVGGGTTQIRAIVTDSAGNQLQGIGVVFSSDNGTLKSGGRVIRTNVNGAAFDMLTTTAETTVVTATTLNGKTGTVTITAGGTNSCQFIVSPTDPNVGQVVTFTDTSSDQGNISRFLWDFGDGDTGSGRSTTHVYRTQGTFTVVHSVVNKQGFTTVCPDTQTVTVSSSALTCDFTFSPEAPLKGEAVTFDASQSSSPNGDIRSYRWDFGDGSAIVVRTDPIVTHSYSGNGSFTVTLTVTDTTGESSSCTGSGPVPVGS